MRRLVPLSAVLLLSLTLTARAGDNWPAFHGGAQAGVAEAPTLPDTWDSKTNVLWKAEIPGRGWSSPVVWGGRVFLTSAVSEVKGPEARKGLYINDLAGKVPPGEHRWLVHCLDAATGKTLWRREAFRGPAPATLHIKNTHASETPVVDGERVCAYFGNVGLICYDHQGNQQWKKKMPAYKTTMGWGTAASPALHDGRLYVVNDNEEYSSLTCFDARIGQQVWQVERTEKSNWVTPFVWKNKLRTEIVTAGSKRVLSYDQDGKPLWELRGMSAPAIPSPFAAGGLLFVTSGYVLERTLKPIYAIRPGASGDITPSPNEDSTRWLAWCRRQAGPYHPTPVVYGDYMYVLYDRGFLSCFEARTGAVVYDKQRLGASAFTASPWAYGGKIFCMSEDGDTFVVRAGREFKVLGRNSLEEMSMATPALAGGSLFLRTESRLYCLRKGQAPSSE
jgi:outer membrane protein assembly factor BamB